MRLFSSGEVMKFFFRIDRALVVGLVKSYITVKSSPERSKGYLSKTVGIGGLNKGTQSVLPLMLRWLISNDTYLVRVKIFFYL
jgi:hypothetical protein